MKKNPPDPAVLRGERLETEQRRASRIAALTVIAVMAFAAGPLAAQGVPPSDSARTDYVLSLQGAGRKVTTHAVTIRGQRVEYDATIGSITLRDDNEQPIAAIAYIAYARRNAGELKRRPVLFAWNGGPIVSSSLLHLNVLGPRRFVVDDEGRAKRPVAFMDNDGSPLDLADLVMVDPVGTGFSAAIGAGKARDFFGLESDAKSFTQFIARYLAETGRSGAPLFLLGESYGTMRTAVVAGMLAKRGVPMAGLVFVSAALNGNSLWESYSHLEPYIFRLPTYAAIALYHNKLAKQPPALEPFLKEVERFALEEFTPTLFAWPHVTPEQRARVLEKLERYTGVPQATWEKAELRYGYQTYVQEFMRDRGLVLLASDARQSSPARPPGRGRAAGESSGGGEPGISQYLRDELGVVDAPPYLGSAATGGWDYTYRPRSDGVPAYPYYIDDLVEAMKANPRMQVALHSGIYDLTTNYYAAEWSMERMNIPAALRANVHIAHYEAGHAMYQHPASFKLFASNLATFITTATERTRP